jgi:hypothetical protein
VGVRYLKSRGVVGIVVTSMPGEFAARRERLPPVGHLDGKVDTFVVDQTERIVKMEMMVGIVIEQIR